MVPLLHPMIWMFDVKCLLFPNCIYGGQYLYNFYFNSQVCFKIKEFITYSLLFIHMHTIIIIIIEKCHKVIYCILIITQELLMDIAFSVIMNFMWFYLFIVFTNTNLKCIFFLLFYAI